MHYILVDRVIENAFRLQINRAHRKMSCDHSSPRTRDSFSESPRFLPLLYYHGRFQCCANFAVHPKKPTRRFRIEIQRHLKANRSNFDRTPNTGLNAKFPISQQLHSEASRNKPPKADAFHLPQSVVRSLKRKSFQFSDS